VAPYCVPLSPEEETEKLSTAEENKEEQNGKGTDPDKERPSEEKEHEKAVGKDGAKEKEKEKEKEEKETPKIPGRYYETALLVEVIPSANSSTLVSSPSRDFSRELILLDYQTPEDAGSGFNSGFNSGPVSGPESRSASPPQAKPQMTRTLSRSCFFSFLFLSFTRFPFFSFFLF